MGYQFIEGQTQYKWYGKHVGDYPLPEGMKVSDMGNCIHAIKVPGCDYEIGVIKDPMGTESYKLIWDFWDKKLPKTVGQDAWKLVQKYELQQTKRGATEKGWIYNEKSLKDRERITVYDDKNREIQVDSMNGTAEIKVETFGFTGADCVSGSEFLKKLLGEEVAIDFKPTYYEDEEKAKIVYKNICG